MQRVIPRYRYTFSDIPSSEPVTADRTTAVIGYGEQPATQLSLDYVPTPLKRSLYLAIHLTVIRDRFFGWSR